MRRLAVAAIAALAACSVKLEGAPCATDQNCPDEQRCVGASGARGRCVVCPPLGETVGTGCPQADVVRCNPTTKGVDTCMPDAASGCLVWHVQKPCTGGLTCGTSGGAPDCQCDVAASDLVVDPAAGSPAGAAPFPTGRADPPQCRFVTISAAFASWSAGITSVTVQGAGPSPAVFSAAQGEIFPLDVPPGVELRTADASPIPANYVIAIDDAGASPGVRLSPGSSLTGFTVRSTQAVGTGIEVACPGSPGPVGVTGVLVDGAGKLATGIDVTGACPTTLTDVSASGAIGPGLRVASLETSVPTAVTRGLYGQNGVGMRLVTGAVTLTGEPGAAGPVEVASNIGSGIVVRPEVATSVPAVSVVAAGLDVHDNGDVGILVREVSPTSAVSVVSSTIHRNAAVTSYGPAPSRKAGGLLVWGPPPTFILRGTRVCANSSDQVGVYASTGAVDLGARSCATANTFAAVPAGNAAVWSTGAVVDASYAYWPDDPPTLYVNGFVSYSPTCGMVANCP